MPSPEPVAIRSGPLEARFLPQNGGRMTHLAHDRLGNILVPTSSPEFDPLNWPKAGAYPLFPYHNRLIGAAFTHEGQRHEVLPHPALAPDAQHGPAHRRPWKITAQDAASLDLVLDYRADGDWPFSFRALQRFTLDDDMARVKLTITNTGDTSMPSGFGWHPYFNAGFDQPASSDATKIWPVDRTGIPYGAPPEARQSQDFPAEGFTDHLSGWHHAGILLNGAARVNLTAGPELPHLVAHRTPAYLCLEPVSHVAGVFGFPLEDQLKAGLLVVQPGAEKSADLTIRITPMAEAV